MSTQKSLALFQRLELSHAFFSYPVSVDVRTLPYCLRLGCVVKDIFGDVCICSSQYDELLGVKLTEPFKL